MPLQRLFLVGRVELLLQPDALFQRLDVGGRQFAFFLHVPCVLLRRVWRGFREGDGRGCAPVVAQDARNMFGVGTRTLHRFRIIWSVGFAVRQFRFPFLCEQDFVCLRDEVPEAGL